MARQAGTQRTERFLPLAPCKPLNGLMKSLNALDPGKLHLSQQAIVSIFSVLCSVWKCSLCESFVRFVSFVVFSRSVEYRLINIIN